MEIEKDVLLVYLDNIRILETILHSTDIYIDLVNEKLGKVSEDFQKIGETNNASSLTGKALRVTKPSREDIKRQRNDKDSFLYYYIFGLNLSVILGACCFLFPHLKILWGAFAFLVLFTIVCFIIRRKHIAQRRKEIEEEFEKQMNSYNEEKRKHEEREKRVEKAIKEARAIARAEMSRLSKLLEILTNERNEIQRYLNEAYSVNIIPFMFRNIEGAYYLCDYVSVSNRGLSESLMQCDFDTIRQKLDNVIEYQGDMIIKQAQGNAAVYEQYQQIIDVAQSNMANSKSAVTATAMAQKYAQISATNSAIAGKMQMKELGYQKAQRYLRRVPAKKAN